MINGTLTPVQAAIQQANADFIPAFHEPDAQETASHDTSSGKLLLTHSNSITESLTICAFWQEMLDMEFCCTMRITVLQQCARGLEQQWSAVWRLLSRRRVWSGVWKV